MMHASFLLSLFLASGLFLCSAWAADNSLVGRTRVIKINADQQTYEGTLKRTFFRGHVQVDLNDVRITGPQADVDMDSAGNPTVAVFSKRSLLKRTLLLPNGSSNTQKPVVDTIEGNVLRMYLLDDVMRAEGDTVSYVTSVASDPFTIRADVQQFDNAAKLVTAEGHVDVKHKGMTAQSPRALLKMGASGKAERAIFTGGATVAQDHNIIRAGVVTLMVQSGNMVAENNVVTDVKNDNKAGTKTTINIRSNYQQYDKASDVFLASGQVVVLYDDYLATGPKVSFKLNHGVVDEMTLSGGRCTITESERTIVADRIVIRTNPKHFDALGKVQTRFRSQGAQKSGAGAAKPVKLAPSKEEAQQLLN